MNCFIRMIPQSSIMIDVIKNIVVLISKKTSFVIILIGNGNATSIAYI